MSERVQRFWSHEARNIRCVREADYDTMHAEAEVLRDENGRLREERDSFQREGIRAMEDVEAARGLLESAVVLFACHCTDATAKNWHDAAAAFLTATPKPA